MNSGRISICAVVIFLAAGCSSSYPSPEILARTKVLVMGDIPALDKRIHAETQVCGAFNEVGIAALEASTVFPMEAQSSMPDLVSFVRKHQIPWLLLVTFNDTNAPLIARNPAPQTVTQYSSNKTIDALNAPTQDNPVNASTTAEHLDLPPQIFGYLVEAQTDSLMWKAEMSTVRANDWKVAIREFSTALAQHISQQHLLDSSSGK